MKPARFMTILTFIIAALTLPLQAEYVFLKDGSIIEGQITSDTASAIVIRDKDKKQRTITRNDIMRILYTEIYLGKIYVQKIDGKNEICYMVDEDRETYTFRRELYRPEEFTMRRDQVLFIARGNPTGLEGEAGTGTVELKWFPPYNPVKYYRLYIKAPGDSEFRVLAETKSKSYTVKNLKSNTRYFIYVTALDAAGDESLPSNELAVTTLNIKPERPVKLRYEKRDTAVNKNGKQVTEVKKFIAWDPVTDTDGTIKGYNVYRYKEGTEEKISTVSKTEYGIPEGVSVYDLRITAVDDRNDESPSSRIRHPRAVKIGVQPVYFVPMGKIMTAMFEPGYGATAYLGLRNFFMQNIELGISGGAVMLPGTDTEKVDSMLFAPVTFDAGYHFAMGEFFSVMPCVSLGFAYMELEYKSAAIPKNRSSFEPVGRAGAMVNYEFEYLQLSAGASYGFIYETSGLKPFVEVYIRAGAIIDL